MSRVVGALLAIALAGSTARADVIPSRRADDQAAEARREVTARLERLGLVKDRAAARADQLTDRESRYFAEDLNRVQLAGDEQVSGFPTAAFVEGVVLLGAVAGVSSWRAYNH